jgi:hypothetical protein
LEFLKAFGKKLAETKIVARVNVKKIKAKKLKKDFLMGCSEAATIFYKNLVFWRFFGHC